MPLRPPPPVVQPIIAEARRKLYDMVVYVVAMCSLTVQLLYAIAAVLSIYSATSIYIKLQAGEEGFTKSVMVLVGSCLFMIGATIVMPAFFDSTLVK